MREGTRKTYLEVMEEEGLIHWAPAYVERHGRRWARVARLGPAPPTFEELLADIDRSAVRRESARALAVLREMGANV